MTETTPGIPNIIYQTYTDIQMLQPPNQSTGDRYGCDIALSGNKNILLIGSQDEAGSAPSHDGNGTYNDDSISSGAVYIYNLVNNQYVLSKYLKSPTPEVNIQFGWAVEINELGNIIAVTGKGYDSNSGCIYIYEYINNDWQFREIIEKTSGPTFPTITANSQYSPIGSNIEGEAADDQSGYSVSLSSDGMRVAIGAHTNDGNSNQSGHVRVWGWSVLTEEWIKIGQDIDGEAADDQSGYSVSLNSDGTRVAIGAILNDGGGSNSGHVRVWEYNVLTEMWNIIGQDINGKANTDFSGWSVSLSSDGTRVAIGAVLNDDSGTSSGHVRVWEYKVLTDEWVQTGQDIPGEAAQDRSGCSVSLNSDGTILAVGAHSNDGNVNNSGHVKVYQYLSGNWTQLGGDIYGEAAEDNSGWSVSLSSDGTRVAVGARNNDDAANNSGHVRVYQYSSGTWTPLGQDIDGEAASDHSGWSVSLSSDGTIVAIGTPYNDGNGDSSGHVRIYHYDGSNWKKIGPDLDDLDGEAAYDQSGYSVSLSSDGTRLAVGAHGWRPAGGSWERNSGYVKVYELTDSLSPKVLPADDIELDFGIRIKLNRLGNKLYISSDIWRSTRTFHEYEYINNSWTRTHTFINDGSDDKFGCNFDLNYNEDILVIGADNAFNNNKRGAVYVFNKINGTWGNYIAYLQGTTQGSDDFFGNDVKISGDGNTILVISYNNPSNTNYHKGAIFVFNLINGSWTETNVIKLPITYDESDKIYGGLSINYYGNLITFSGYHLNNKGRIYIAYLDNSNWILSSHIESSIPLDNSLFGSAFFGTGVIQNNEKLIISEQARSNLTGAVYVFDGVTEPNIIATGALLKIIPNFSLNNLI